METVIPISSQALLDSLKSLKDQPSETEDVKETRQLADLLAHPGWDILERRIRSRINGLKELVDSIEGSETVELIGFKFLASRVAIAHLEGVISDVRAADQYQSEPSAGQD